MNRIAKFYKNLKEGSKNDSFRIAWVRLARTKGIGSRTFPEIIRVFGDPEAALDELPKIAFRSGKKKFSIITKKSAEKEISLVEEFGAKMIFSCEPAYPTLLKQISDYPPIITIKGNESLLHQDKISIVGSRNASINGTKLAASLAYDLTSQGFVIISGLAKGIDTAAHKASVNTSTIGVIAGGINNIYPKENSNLYQNLYNDGLVITEQPFNQIASSENFPRRNRIISGLSLGVIVVESTDKSGTLITARFAAEQGREVFAIPGSPLDPRHKGTNALIKDGAILVQSSEDIIHELSHMVQSKVRTDYFDSGESSFSAAGSDIKFPSDIEIQEAKSLILEKLSHDPVQIDDIISDAGIPNDIVTIAILELELGEQIERSYGNTISLKA